MKADGEVCRQHAKLCYLLRNKLMRVISMTRILIPTLLCLCPGLRELSAQVEVITGSPAVTSQSLESGGDNHYLHLPGDSNFGEIIIKDFGPADEWSVGFWVRWEILGRHTTPMILKNDPETPAMLGINSGWFGSGFQFFCQNSESQLITSYAEGALQNRDWMHAAVSVSKYSYRIFVNGYQVLEKDFSDSHAFQDGMLAQLFKAGQPRWYIGKQDHPDNHVFRGDIDDIFVYTRALTQEDIIKLKSDIHSELRAGHPDRILIEDFEVPESLVTPSDINQVLFKTMPSILNGTHPADSNTLRTGYHTVHFIFPDDALVDGAKPLFRHYSNGTEVGVMNGLEMTSDGTARMRLPVDFNSHSVLVEVGNKLYSAEFEADFSGTSHVPVVSLTDGSRVRIEAMPEISGLSQQFCLEIQTPIDIDDNSGVSLKRVRSYLTSNSHGIFPEVLLSSDARLLLHCTDQTVELKIPDSLWAREAFQYHFSVPYNQLHYTTVEQYSRKNGLISKNIDHLQITRDGTPWIAHIEEGLNFFHNGGFHSVEDMIWKEVRCLSVSPQGGKVYAAAEDGLYILSKSKVESEKIGFAWKLSRSVHDLELMRQFSGIRTLQVFHDLRGNLWIGSVRGLQCLSSSGELSEVMQFGNVVLDDVNSILELPDGSILVNSWTFGPLVCRSPENSMEFQPMPAVNDFFRGNSVLCLEMAPSGRLWIGSDNGLFSYEPVTQKFERHWDGEVIEIFPFPEINHTGSIGSLNEPPTPEMEAMAFLAKDGRYRVWIDGVWGHIGDDHGKQIGTSTSMLVDSRGRLWVGSAENGIFSINIKNPYLPLSQADDISTLDEKVSIVALDIDKYGNTWIVDSENQIKIIKNSESSENPYAGKSQPRIKPVLGNLNCGKSNPVDGSFWIGGKHGLLRISEDGSRRFLVDENWVTPSDVNSIAFDTDGTLWVSTHGAGLVHTNTDGEIIHKFDLSSRRHIRYVRCALPLGDGRVLVGTDGGLILIDEEFNESFIPIQPPIQAVSELISAPEGFRVSALTPVRESSGSTSIILVGTVHGLFELDFSRVNLLATSVSSFPSNSILSIHQWHDKRFFIGTDGGYLHIWDRSLQLSNQIGPEYGVTGDAVTHIASTDFSTIWLGLNEGAVCFFPRFFKPQAPGLSISYGGRNMQVDHDDRPVQVISTEKLFLTFSDSDELGSMVNKFKYLVFLDDALSGNTTLVQKGSYISGGSPIGIDNPDGNFGIEVVGFDPFLNQSHRVKYSIEKRIPFFSSSFFSWSIGTAAAGGLILALVLIVRHWRFSKAVECERQANFERLKNKNRELSIAIDKANQAAEAKSRFLACMSHEIRTPMNGILGMTEVLSETRLTSEQKDYKDTIASCAQGLLRIINDILDFSKLEAGKLGLENVPFSLNTMISEVVQRHRAVASRKSVEFISHISGRLPDSVIGDPLRIKQILDNLLGNAIKFSPGGSVTIEIVAKNCSGHTYDLHFSISDTGIGIPKEKLQDIFSAFDQVDPSTTRKYGGTGLGLAITRELVELLGGNIEVESDEGRGSRFTVSIPMVIDPSADLASTVLHSSHSSISQNIDSSRNSTLSAFFEESHYSHGKSSDQGNNSQPGFNLADSEETPEILVVEDNIVNQKIMVRLLMRLGYKVDVVSNGLDAVDQFKKPDCPYKLVFMDCQMPVMDGLTASREIRRLIPKEFNAVRIVALTANAFDNDRANCLEAGMDEFIPKPVSMSILRKYLESCDTLKPPRVPS